MFDILYAEIIVTYYVLCGNHYVILYFRRKLMVFFVSHADMIFRVLQFKGGTCAFDRGLGLGLYHTRVWQYMVYWATGGHIRCSLSVFVKKKRQKSHFWSCWLIFSNAILGKAKTLSVYESGGTLGGAKWRGDEGEKETAAYECERDTWRWQ